MAECAHCACVYAQQRILWHTAESYQLYVSLQKKIIRKEMKKKTINAYAKRCVKYASWHCLFYSHRNTEECNGRWRRHRQNGWETHKPEWRKHKWNKHKTELNWTVLSQTRIIFVDFFSSSSSSWKRFERWQCNCASFLFSLSRLDKWIYMCVIFKLVPENMGHNEQKLFISHNFCFKSVLFSRATPFQRFTLPFTVISLSV